MYIVYVACLIDVGYKNKFLNKVYMKRLILLSLLAFGTFESAASLNAQGAQANNLVDIALNGIPVTVDGNLADWNDAHFIFLSQDSPFFLQITNGQPVQGVPQSPADFSAFVALKMTNEALYVAARVRDEGVPLYGAPATPNLAFDFDHISVYLGLYDIGSRAASPHIEGTNPEAPSNFQFINPINGERFDANRHYRIGPGTDDTQSTLGPDYQLLLRAIEHNPATFDSRSHTYSGAYVDTTIGGTTAAVVLWANERGYDVEWRIPFASLAGKISRTGPFSDFEWPLFEPAHDMIIPFDIDVTDRDVPQGLNTYLRAGRYPSLWRDSHRFDMRGRIVDVSIATHDQPNTSYYIDYKTMQNVTVDGDMSDWADAMFYGNSQDHPHFLQITNNSPVQGIPQSPADFSYYYAMKMDDENLYVGLIVRDEGTPMIATPALPNLSFAYDHLSVYLGLFDIGDLPGSPHIEGNSPSAVSNFRFIHPTIPDSTFENELRHYRIRPGSDNTQSTLGPDYQLLLRNLPHDPTTFNSRAHTYNGAHVDTTIAGTVAAGAYFDDEKGYFIEWKIPFTSLAGNIARTQGRFRDFDWPLFVPEPGMTIVFDADVTDLDEGDRGNNRFMRLGRYPALWRDSHNFGMRGKIIENGLPATSITYEPFGRDEAERPTSIQLNQNYPNPFNPSTTIRFALPESAPVRLSVFNMIGQEVAVLVNGVQQAGVSTVTFDASNLSSGIYIYRLSNGVETVTRKMLLIK
jgi:hypothetical protein